MNESEAQMDPREQREQYARGTTRRDRPTEIVDQNGDTWVWVDADRQGVPGYQWLGGGTIRQQAEPLGPAHTRGYVVQARFCRNYQAGQPCDRYDHG